MRHVRTFLPITIVFLSACAAPIVDDSESAVALVEAAPAQEEDDGEERAREIASLERKLEVARARLQVARLEASSYDHQQEASMRHGKAEVKLAEAGLARFAEADKPNRLASAKLNLQTAKDRAKEAAEELAQIEIMYKDQDLDDLTAEFVVSRGRRNAARAAARIAIQEGEVSALEERELPQEERRLALALDKASAGLGGSERDAEIGRRKQAISVQEAENEIVRLEADLAALREKAKP